MNKLFVLACFAVLILSNCSQSELNSFNQTIDKGIGRCVTADGDNNILLGGDCLFAKENCTGFVYKINQAGKVIWRHDIEYDNKLVVMDIETDKDDKVYLSFVSNQTEIFVLCLSKKGEKLWLKSAGTGRGPTMPLHFKVNKFGEIYLIKDSKTIIKCDQAFTQTHGIELLTEGHFDIKSFHPDNNGLLTVIGNGTANIIEVKQFTQTGKMLKSFEFKGKRFAWGHDIVKVGYEHFAFSGITHYNSEEDTANLFVGLLNDQLDSIWTREIPIKNFGGGFKNIDVLNEKEIVICMTSKDTMSNKKNDALLFKLNMDGDLLSQNFIGSAKDEYTFDLSSSGGHVVFTGAKSDSIWLVSESL